LLKEYHICNSTNLLTHSSIDKLKQQNINQSLPYPSLSKMKMSIV